MINPFKSPAKLRRKEGRKKEVRKEGERKELLLFKISASIPFVGLVINLAEYQRFAAKPRVMINRFYITGNHLVNQHGKNKISNFFQNYENSLSFVGLVINLAED